MKKIISILVLLGLVLSLASCSSTDPDQDQVEEPTSKVIIGQVHYDPSDSEDNEEGLLRILLEEKEVILENDLEGILEYGLTENDFYDGFTLIDKEDSERYLFFDSNTKIEILEDMEFEDRVFLAEVTVRDDYAEKIREISPAEIKSQVYAIENPGPTINNGGHYVKYGEDIYYREYNSGSFEDVALWNEFPYDPYGVSKIIKLSPDGSKEIVWEGYAFGGFFIYEDLYGEIFFVQNQSLGIEDGSAEYGHYIQTIVVDLEGRNLIEYEGGSVFDMDQDRHLAIIEGHNNTLEVLDLETGAARVLTDPFRRPIIYDQVDGKLYYENYEPKAMLGEENYIISTININGGQLADIFVLDYERAQEVFQNEEPLGNYHFVSPRLSGDFLWIYAITYEGSGTIHSLSDYELIKIHKEGDFYETIGFPFAVDWFGLEKVFSFREDSPFTMDVDNFEIYDLENIIVSKTVLTGEDLENLGHKGAEYFDESGSMSLENMEYLDGNLFFTVIYGEREAAVDVGWRYAYRLSSGSVYKKNLVKDEIELLYEY